MVFIGELIDKLSIVNIKIWDATGKANEAYRLKQQKKAHQLFNKVELMNTQRRELIREINIFFHTHVDILNQKTFKGKIKL